MEKIKSMVWEMTFKNYKTQAIKHISVDTTNVYQAINTVLRLVVDRPRTQCADIRLSVNNRRVDVDATFKLGAVEIVEIVGAGPKLRFRACRVSEIIDQILINDINTVNHISILNSDINSIVHEVQDDFRYLPFSWNIQYSLPDSRQGEFYSLAPTLDKAIKHFLSMNPHATLAAVDKLTVSFGGHEFLVDDLCAWYMPYGRYNASVYCNETFSSIEQAIHESSGDGPMGICHFTLESVIQHIFRQYPVETLLERVGSIKKPIKVKQPKLKQSKKPNQSVDEVSTDVKELSAAFNELSKEYTQSLEKLNKALNKLGSITAELLNK